MNIAQLVAVKDITHRCLKSNIQSRETSLHSSIAFLCSFGLHSSKIKKYTLYKNANDSDDNGVHFAVKQHIKAHKRHTTGSYATDFMLTCALDSSLHANSPVLFLLLLFFRFIQSNTLLLCVSVSFHSRCAFSPIRKNSLISPFWIDLLKTGFSAIFSTAAHFRCATQSLFTLIHFVCFRKLKQTT